MGSGTSTTTQATTAEPYKGAKPLIDTAMSDASKLYNKGIGGQTYTGSTVVPFANQTMAGMNNQMGLASNNVDGKGMSAPLQDILNNGGFTDTQNKTMAGMDQLQNSRALNDTINGDGLNSYARNAMYNWQKDANGQFDLNSNPAFQQVQQNAVDNASKSVNAQAAAAGRYGSGVNQQVLGREVGNTAANLGYQEYNNWQSQKNQANQNLFNGGNTALANQSAAINTKAGLQQNLFNAQNAGIGNMSSAFNTLQDPSRAAMGVGSMYEDLYKRTLDDKLRVFNDSQNRPWEQVGRLMGTANLTGQYAPSNVTSTAPGPNSLLQGVGQAATGMNLLSGAGIV